MISNIKERFEKENIKSPVFGEATKLKAKKDITIEDEDLDRIFFEVKYDDISIKLKNCTLNDCNFEEFKELKLKNCMCSDIVIRDTPDTNLNNCFFIKKSHGDGLVIDNCDKIQIKKSNFISYAPKEGRLNKPGIDIGTINHCDTSLKIENSIFRGYKELLSLMSTNTKILNSEFKDIETCIYQDNGSKTKLDNVKVKNIDELNIGKGDIEIINSPSLLIFKL